MFLTDNAHVLLARLTKKLAIRERKLARERDAKKIQLDLGGLNFINFINFIDFDHAPKQ